MISDDWLIGESPCVGHKGFSGAYWHSDILIYYNIVVIDEYVISWLSALFL